MRRPVAPPPLDQLLEKYKQRLPDVLRRGAQPTVDGHYIHWDKLRRKTPRPADLSAGEWWTGIRLARFSQSRPLPLRDTRGIPVPEANREGLKWVLRYRRDETPLVVVEEVPGVRGGPHPAEDHRLGSSAPRSCAARAGPANLRSRAVSGAGSAARPFTVAPSDRRGPGGGVGITGGPVERDSLRIGRGSINPPATRTRRTAGLLPAAASTFYAVSNARSMATEMRFQLRVSASN